MNFRKLQKCDNIITREKAKVTGTKTEIDKYSLAIFPAIIKLFDFMIISTLLKYALCKYRDIINPDFHF